MAGTKSKQSTDLVIGLVMKAAIAQLCCLMKIYLAIGLKDRDGVTSEYLLGVEADCACRSSEPEHTSLVRSARGDQCPRGRDGFDVLEGRQANLIASLDTPAPPAFPAWLDKCKTGCDLLALLRETLRWYEARSHYRSSIW